MFQLKRDAAKNQYCSMSEGGVGFSQKRRIELLLKSNRVDWLWFVTCNTTRSRLVFSCSRCRLYNAGQLQSCVTLYECTCTYWRLRLSHKPLLLLYMIRSNVPALLWVHQCLSTFCWSLFKMQFIFSDAAKTIRMSYRYENLPTFDQPSACLNKCI